MLQNAASDLDLHCLPFIQYYYTYQEIVEWTFKVYELASATHLDACQIGDQEVAGSTPARSATIFHGDSS